MRRPDEEGIRKDAVSGSLEASALKAPRSLKDAGSTSRSISSLEDRLAVRADQ
ncbi:hypothetical protein SF83666_c20100 [Sinorhizobium fredii CCBAU 83666]|nr:hypothetical protein SF83666_c20100 [Sinorhizobium fredii CCBAU 83666]